MPLQGHALHECARGPFHEAGQAHIKLAVVAVVEGARGAVVVTCVADDFRCYAVAGGDVAGTEEIEGASVVDVVEG